MKAPSLSSKTVRPGSLNGFSYYYSGQRPAAAKKPGTKPAARHSRRRTLFGLVLLAVVAGVALVSYGSQLHNAPATTPATKPAAAPAAVANLVPTGHCANNSLSQLIKVSLSQRHLWVCQAGTEVYNSPVITGIATYASTVTPTGTYHIYSKQTNITLSGADATGSWSDPVSYWLPFLSNQYGIYGFHDATWRSNSAFGTIDPSSPNASHGCVELPLASAAWLYNWANVGTTLTIAS